ncbi:MULTISPECIES: hypothetical protein [Gammaproteobacteria]|jgi:hypothetical protein|uniref:hypothetical protein n=2 Tax=Pseudomonadota TaxID=1224 RepID=UPI000948E933|nr:MULTISPECIES: hypothetical protein [Gammaproteobacteria]MDC9602803.1 hypothetical protein [Pseudoalteromonas sp. GABNS16G]OLF82987.1 hypothetical protein AWH63_04455 [Marinobacter sp. C18]|tara:strand:+ start:2130 stop:4190 length:2061 start_codon:yes stop_codon:yes gene_type:complete
MIEAVIRHKDKDFSVAELESVLAAGYLKSVVKIGNRLAKGYSVPHMESVVKSIKVFGQFLSASQHASSIPQDLKVGIAPLHSRGGWMHFLNQFGHHLKENHAPAQVRQYTSCMGLWLKNMAGEMICPANLEVPNHLPLMQEGGKRSILGAKLSKEAEADLEAAAKALKSFDIEGLEDDDDLASVAKGVFHDLIDQLGEIQGLSSENFLFLVQSTLEGRLEAIYRGALDRFKSAVAKREEGQLLVKNGLPYMGFINHWLTYEGSFKFKAAKPILQRVRELTDDQFEAGIHAWCVHYHQFRGLHPYESQTNDQVVRRYFKERSKRPSLDLSADTMIGYHGASRDLLIAAYILITFETCANASSVQKLTVDSKKDITESLSVIDWVKDRAKAVLSKFDVRRDFGLSSVIETVAEATENYRKIAIRADDKYLFLHAYGADASAKNRQKEEGKFLVKPSGNWFNEQSKIMIREFNDGKWTATVKNIRASILLAHALKYGTKATQNLAQHGSSRTTVGYLATAEMRLKHEEKIRAFQEWLQVLVTINIDDIPNKLGLAEDAYEEIKERIVNSRFGGSVCSDPMGGHQPGSVVGKPCTQIKMCMTCEKRLNLFVASEENVAHLLHWRDALKSAFENGRVSENDLNWTLWSVFIDTMHDRMEGSLKHKGLLRDVRNRIAEDENPYHRIFARSVA